MMPTIEECTEGYERLLNDLEDIESDTFREHWFYRAHVFKVMGGCKIQYNRLLEQAYLRYSKRTLEYLTKQDLHVQSPLTNSNSTVLSKEERKCIIGF